MAYKIKPNYHFYSETETGINTVPIGRFVIVENFGVSNEIKWFRKISDTSLTDETTILQAALMGNIDAPIDLKRDISDSYSKTEIDSVISVKSNISDIYTKTYIDETFATKADTLSVSEIETLAESKAPAYVSVPQSAFGKIGDTAGMMAVDNNYIYRCVSTFSNGLEAIWSRIEFTNSVW